MRQNNFAQNLISDKDSNSDSTNSSYDLGISPNNKIMDLQNSINFNKNKYKSKGPPASRPSTLRRVLKPKPTILMQVVLNTLHL